MLRIALALCLFVLASPVSASAVDSPAPFRKGVSLQLFTFPATAANGYADDPFPGRAGAEDYFSIARLRASGFDHVRLPVDVGPFLDDPDERNWRAFRIYFRRFVENLKRNGLNVIVTLVAPSLNGQIPEDQLDDTNGPRFARYLAVATRFASELESWRIENLALEPMNEPQRACRKTESADWLEYQDILIARMRAKAPRLWLGITGGCWSKIEGLAGIGENRLRDKQTFVSVHFYDPFLFTHQGADWTLDIMPFIGGLPYPAQAGHLEDALARARARAASNKDGAAATGLLSRAEDAIRNYFNSNAGADTIQAELKVLKDWGFDRKVAPGRIVFTEFGAMKTPGGAASRARWLHDVSHAVASDGWGWTLWVLRQGPFGLDEAGRYDPALFEALGARAP
ncbi:MAG: hypothetical protein EKK40_11290 [Bradyrhizobiaceae bacterium]|nr:MAG: hypothetical protein EKK40_11290 [Bradyrhizobiaceae bacterium]